MLKIKQGSTECDATTITIVFIVHNDPETIATERASVGGLSLSLLAR